MIKKILLLITLIVFQQSMNSQAAETCDNSAEDPILDLNSITKCSIEETKDKTASRNSQKVNIQVSSRRRVVRKRNAVSGISKTNTSHKIANLKEKASLVGSLDLNNEEVLENVPFKLVEEIPLFRACEKSPIAEQNKCFKKEISSHIRKNFRYPESAYENSVQGRVYAQFVIDKTGEITNLNIRGPYKGELLEAEAKRIVKKLPKFKPGKHNGKIVKVKYGIPITFKIPGKKASNIRKKYDVKKSNVVLTDVVNFTSVDQIPSFETCNNSNDTSENCFNKQIINHVNKYFAYPQQAVNQNIEGKVIAHFVIDKKGQVVNIVAKGPQGAQILENATKKLFEKLPHFTPGKHNGKVVDVKHSFPIDFKLK